MIAAAIAVVVAGTWYFSHHRSDSAAPADPAEAPARRGGGRFDPSKRPTSVGVAQVRLGDINVYQTGLGTAVPRNVVTVRPRVDGELIKVPFKEGQMVQEGDLLAQIDPRPYQVALAQAQGQLVRDQALLRNAQLDYERYKTLLAQDSTSQQQLDTQGALVHQYQGVVKADQGQVDSAALSLSFTRVTAPLSGRAGLRQVDPGNIVHATDTTGIVIITQVEPMTVVFAVPETRIAQIVTKLRAGAPVPVEAWDRDNRDKIATGVLVAADNQVDTTTGTVKLRAEFGNKDHKLFANQFVNARALVDVRRQVPVIPSAAVQIGNDGSFVYVVQPDNTVKVQTIKTGIADGSLVAVDSGLTPGQTIVVDGLDRLREGSKVQIGVEPGAAPSGAARPGAGASASASGSGSSQAGTAAQGSAPRHHRRSSEATTTTGS
ncbi:MAG: MdtA/MuxA family multidrug efflux RND transporter periplasmic adaptor subunit [Proteobacteria bacterium]|nr:MdtA/MuxA family multidrug efflux RND transporter periplasmic adaptor subunit [Pseudomonadota bacterium]